MFLCRISSFDIHYQLRCLYANTQSLAWWRKRFYQNIFLLSRKIWKLPSPSSHHSCCLHIYLPRHTALISKRGTSPARCSSNVWYEYLLEHMLRQMIQNLIKKLFTSNHLNRKSSRDFCHGAYEILSVRMCFAVVHWQKEKCLFKMKFRGSFQRLKRSETRDFRD